jgi:RNA polymerase sigma-70 factor (ECF subfamily)
MAVVLEVVQPALEETGIEALYREHHPRIVAILARLTGDRQHAEDIAADVFCKFAQQPAALAGRDNPTAWLYRVATNAGLDALRKHSRRRRREEQAGVETLHRAAPADALQEILQEERRTRVRVILEGLKPRDAQLLLLRSSGLAYREIAPALGVALGSVGTLLARAEAEFERNFRAQFGDLL